MANSVGSPPVPPRRAIPTPDRSPRVDVQSETSSIDTTPFVGGIAARIAALNLSGQVPGGKPAPALRSVTTLKTIPPSETNSSSQLDKDGHNTGDSTGSNVRARRSTGRLATELTPEALEKALKRKPPPPPKIAPLHQKLPPSVDPEETVQLLPPLPPRKVPVSSTRQVNQIKSDRQGADNCSVEPVARRVPPPPLPRSLDDDRSSTSSISSVNRTTRPPVPTSTRPAIPARTIPTPEPDDDTESSSMTESCLKCQSFSDVDAHAANFPRELISSFSTLPHDLTHPFHSRTEKARAIFTWLHHNIAYDTQAFFTHSVQPSTPESTFRSGMAVCEGYAGLFSDLAMRVGLDVLVITGHGKGSGFVAPESDSVVPPSESNHAWNAVVLDDDRWHLIDACWGAGALHGTVYNQRFAPRWFTSTNDEFGLTHFPSDAQYQMREDGSIQEWAEYICAPARPLELQPFDTYMYASESLCPDRRYIVGGMEYTFHVEKACSHMKERGWWSEDYALILIPSVGESKEVLDRDQEGGWTARVDVPAGESTITMFIVNSWDGRDGKGLDPAVLRRSMGRKAMQFQGIAQWEVR